MVGHHQIFVEDQLFPQPVTGRARPLRRVEAEQPRLDLGDGEARDRAGKAFGKHDPPRRRVIELHAAALAPTLAVCPGRRGIGRIDIGQPVGQLQRLFETVGQPRRQPVAHDDAVDDDFDVMLVFLVERGRVFDVVELAVDAHPGKACALPFGHFLAIFALAAAHHRGQQIQPRAFGQGHHPVDHLADRLRGNRQAGCGRIGHAHPRPEQAHIIVNLGHRGDGGARVAAGGFLLDRNRRRQPFDVIDIGLLHQLQKLARIGGQALDIAALPFGIDGVEGERAFARSGQAGDDDQPVARQVEIDALEVVLARAAHLDMGQHLGVLSLFKG